MYEPDKIGHIPTDAPNKPMDQARQDLWDAAQLLRKHGHCKRVLIDGEGRMCLLGAINKAVFGSAMGCWGGDGRVVQAVNRLNDAYPHRCGVAAHVSWNNAPATTADDVIRALEHAALS